MASMADPISGGHKGDAEGVHPPVKDHPQGLDRIVEDLHAKKRVTRFTWSMTRYC